VESVDSALEDIEMKLAARQRKRLKGAQALVYRETRVEREEDAATSATSVTSATTTTS
jgi:hypothetical protein